VSEPTITVTYQWYLPDGSLHHEDGQHPYPGCGELFCDSCGDCFTCAEDVCFDGGAEYSSHSYIVFCETPGVPVPGGESGKEGERE